MAATMQVIEAAICPFTRRRDQGRQLSPSCPACGSAMGGDANFMPVVGGTKVLPQLLAETHTLLVEAWKQLS